MGRRIDLDRPLTAEDREYLESRARGYEVWANDQKFGHLSPEAREELRGIAADGDAKEKEAQDELEKQRQEQEDLEFDEDLLNAVAQYDVNTLRAKLAELDEPVDGKKGELQQRLLERLQDDRDAELEP